MTQMAGPTPGNPTNGSPDSVLRLTNSLAELPRLIAWLKAHGASCGLPPALVSSLDLALEEWVVNVISYAYEDKASHTIELRLRRDADEVRVTVEDDGRPFDPTLHAEADTSLAPEHRQIGGLGIHFIRKTMDRFDYRRENGRNIVTLAKKLIPSDGKEPQP